MRGSVAPRSPRRRWRRPLAGLIAGCSATASLLAGALVSGQGTSGPPATPFEPTRLDGRYAFDVRVVDNRTGDVAIEVSLRSMAGKDVGIPWSSYGLAGFDVDVDGNVLHLMRLDEAEQERRNRALRQGLSIAYIETPRAELVPGAAGFRSRLDIADGLVVSGRIRAQYRRAGCGAAPTPTQRALVAYVRVTLAVAPLEDGLATERMDDGAPMFMTHEVHGWDPARVALLSATVALPRPVAVMDWARPCL